jgi:4-diphosphocytidyl-2-C-methyl-D-erythritol kinase
MPCHAKVNLTLHLCGPRSDGYTELFSHVLKLKAYEPLYFDEPRTDLLESLKARKAHPTLWFSCSDEALAQLGDQNLVVRAVLAVQQAYLTQAHNAGQPVLTFPVRHAHLEKRLPYQAGMGSGSSNAASALHLANKAYANALGLPPLSLDILVGLGATIGSDVPLFVETASLLEMQGRGERITPYNWNNAPKALHRMGIIILKPRSVNVSTRKAFGTIHAQQAYSTPLVPGASIWQTVNAPFSEVCKQLHNDFHSVVLGQYPVLQELERFLYGEGAAKVLLCGSGSALMGVFEVPLTDTAFKALELRLPMGCDALSTRALGF